MPVVFDYSPGSLTIILREMFVKLICTAKCFLHLFILASYTATSRLILLASETCDVEPFLFNSYVPLLTVCFMNRDPQFQAQLDGRC